MKAGGIRIRKRSVAKLLRYVDAGRFRNPAFAARVCLGRSEGRKVAR